MKDIHHWWTPLEVKLFLKARMTGWSESYAQRENSEGQLVDHIFNPQVSKFMEKFGVFTSPSTCRAT